MCLLAMFVQTFQSEYNTNHSSFKSQENSEYSYKSLGDFFSRKQSSIFFWLNFDFRVLTFDFYKYSSCPVLEDS